MGRRGQYDTDDSGDQIEFFWMKKDTVQSLSEKDKNKREKDKRIEAERIQLEAAKQKSMDILWSEYEQQISDQIPKPEPEEIEAQQEFEQQDGELFCFREDFRDLVKITLKLKQ